MQQKVTVCKLKNFIQHIHKQKDLYRHAKSKTITKIVSFQL